MSRIEGKNKSGFTLVELLIVVAIIAVLIAILLPALNSARQQAGLVQCQSQMRQVYFGFTQYANDFSGVIETTAQWGAYDSSNTYQGLDARSGLWAYVHTVPVLPIPGPASPTFDADSSAFIIAMRKDPIFWCPTSVNLYDTGSFNGNASTWYPWDSTYYSRAASWYPVYPENTAEPAYPAFAANRKFTRLAHPDQLVLEADTGLAGAFSNISPRVPGSSNWVIYRHGNGPANPNSQANFLMADGHLETVREHDALISTAAPPAWGANCGGRMFYIDGLPPQ